MCMCTIRILLFIINTIVGLAGFFLLIFGALLTWGKTFMQDQLYSHIEPLLENLNEVESRQRAIELIEIILQFTAPFSLIIFSFGFVVFFVCLIGVFGSCCKNEMCLKIYIGFLLLITMLEIGSLCFYYSNRTQLFEVTKMLLHRSLLLYKSPASQDKHSMVMNILMYSFNCCGIDGGKDFDQAIHFEKNMTTVDDRMFSHYPLPCCDVDVDISSKNDTCLVEESSKGSNFKRGCWNELMDSLSHYGNLISLIGFSVLFFQIVLIAMTVVVVVMRKH